ncbi:MAG: 1-acyl-sn-glycerol-3-phosphate acyltransferase [Desulfobacterales bacterium]|nr:MAG: 1-acyl-sn-glycerol-3-phosphate acyltransferase [Desulfobacterales bacterium]
MSAEFDDIRPYSDTEIRPVIKRLLKSKPLISGLRKLILPNCPAPFESIFDYIIKAYFSAKSIPIRTVDQFQRKIIIDTMVEWVFNHTTKGFSISGLEYLEKDCAYIFITNHRDILIDTSMLNYALRKNGFRIAAVAFGDNLMINRLVSDLIRANKCFMVKRSLPFRKRVLAAQHLSRYIWFLQEQEESIWIAQGDGRAKDGDDRTNPSLIKMLYLSQRKSGLNLNEYINAAHIIPVAFSYEKDPCDLFKAKELLNDARYDDETKQQDDLTSMYRGISGDKGRMHIAFGKPLKGDYQNAQEVALAIDLRIHRLYKLWPTNYIAYDELQASNEYSTMYSTQERNEVLARFKQKKEDLRLKALAMYAQPVINKRALNLQTI